MAQLAEMARDRARHNPRAAAGADAARAPPATRWIRHCGIWVPPARAEPVGSAAAWRHRRISVWRRPSASRHARAMAFARA
ncbi:hypothetical protein M8494_09215 [Serratia ureilytica]